MLRPLFFTFVAKKNLRFLLNNKVQRSSGATVLAPQQTIVRASANLRCEGAAAN